jgi:hydrogenase maturation factor
MSDQVKDFKPACPVPKIDKDTVQLAHGGGGRLMNQLIDRLFVAGFQSDQLDRRHDSAVLDRSAGVSESPLPRTATWLSRSFFRAGTSARSR